MKTNENFLIIDDDATTTLLYSLMLKRALGDKINVQSFNRPEEGVNYIKNEFKNVKSATQTILFLDINMPILTGWDVLDLLVKMEENMKHLIIYVLSSSIDPNDKKLAIGHPFVAGFIEKPLTSEKIDSILKD